MQMSRITVGASRVTYPGTHARRGDERTAPTTPAKPRHAPAGRRGPRVTSARRSQPQPGHLHTAPGTALRDMDAAIPVRPSRRSPVRRGIVRAQVAGRRRRGGSPPRAPRSCRQMQPTPRVPSARGRAGGGRVRTLAPPSSGWKRVATPTRTRGCRGGGGLSLSATHGSVAHGRGAGARQVYVRAMQGEPVPCSVVACAIVTVPADRSILGLARPGARRRAGGSPSRLAQLIPFDLAHAYQTETRPLISRAPLFKLRGECP